MDLSELLVNIPTDSDTDSSSPQEKRKEYINWQEYFMGIALLSGMRSKDPSCQVGACIVNKEKRIVGVGYNGMPAGCSDDEFPWGKEDQSSLNTKHMYVCHAEINAVLNKYSADIKDCTIYVGRFPCNECAKVIIQSGIREVVFLSNKGAQKDKYIASKKMFDAARITYRQFIPKHNKIEIDFTADDED